MSIETNLNVSPYYDDFNQEKDFYRILFRPGVALQARELTQLQDILQKQIERFGDHIFKSGTIISGVNFQFFDRYSYVKILDNQVDGQPTNVSAYNGLFVRNSSNLVAKIVNVKAGFQSLDPEMSYLYLNYTNSGNTGTSRFYSNSDILTVYNQDNRLYDFVINNGGTNFANTDAVQLTSALLVNSSNVTTGDISQTIGLNTSNVTVLSVNNTFGTITVNGTRYSNTSGFRILRIRPILADLQDPVANTSKWDINSGFNVVQGSNTAFVVAKIGTNATAQLTTDGSGVITDVSVINSGIGYIVEPHVSIKSTTGTQGTLDVVALNYLARVTVANGAFTGGGANPVGFGYAFGVTDGIIYQKGTFLRVEPQTVIVNAYSFNVNAVSVGFATTEAIINSSSDPTLLDVAQGTPNFAAPGAHRLKLTPTLTVVNSSNVAANNTFFTLADFRDGEPYRLFRDTSYSNIAKEFERRTNETNGSFVIDPFLISTKDRATWSNTEFEVVVDPGLAYIEGQRINTERNTRVGVRRGNDVQTLTSQGISLNYGNYIIVREYAGYFDFKSGAQVTIYDTAKQFITSRSTSTSPVGNAIGTARIRSIEHDRGVPGTANARYRVYLFDIRINAGKSFKKDAKSIYYTGAGSGIADIVLDNDTTLSNIAIIYDNNFNSLVFNIDDKPGSKVIANTNNINYSYRTAAEANISSSGILQYTVTGSNVTFDYANNSALSSVQRRDFIITPVANATSANITSSVTATSSCTVINAAAGFTSRFNEGDFIKVYNGANTSQTVFTQVTSITNATHMTVANAWTYSTYTTMSAARHFPAFVPIAVDDFRVSANLNSTGAVLTFNFSNTAGHLTFSSAVNTFITFNIRASQAQEVSKQIKRGVFIKLDLSTHPAGKTGPWCLGLPDIFRLQNVFIGNSSVNTSSTSVVQFFHVNNGQNNDYYGHGHLVLQDKNKLQLNTSDWLLVRVDCFDLSSPTDTGFFTIDSYPLALNAASRPELGNTAINPVEVPEYRNSQGQEIDLQEVIDFRPRVTKTATITSTLGSATVNPANTVAFDASDKRFPQPDSTFTFDYNMFLGRKDRIYIDRNGNIGVVEGRPEKVNKEPPPPIPDTLTLGIIDVPPYPGSPVVPTDNLVRLGSKKVGSDSGPLFTKYKRFTAKVDESVNAFNLQPRRYTMADIGKLERRIVDLEYYTSLNELEKQISDLNIPSETDRARNRFKNGFFVDPFNDYAQTDIANPENSCEIVQNLSILTPPQDKINLQCRFNYANTTTLNSLRSESALSEPGLNDFGESVLMLPPAGTETIIDQSKFTTAVTGTGGTFIFVGDMVIKPANMKVTLKTELRITQRLRSPTPSLSSGPPVGAGRTGSIMCGYLASIGLLSPEMNEKDQEFGIWYAENYPTSYKGYLYFAAYNIEALKGDAVSGFKFIKDDKKRRKILREISWKLLRYISLDWAKYIAYKTDKNATNYTFAGAMIFNTAKSLSWVIGKLVKDIDVAHDEKRAYTALAVTLATIPGATIGKVIDKTIGFLRGKNGVTK